MKIIKSETSDSFVNHFYGHFAYLNPPDWRHFRGSLQKIKLIKNPIKNFIFSPIKSETSDSFVNHFDGHFAYLKPPDWRHFRGSLQKIKLIKNPIKNFLKMSLNLKLVTHLSIISMVILHTKKPWTFNLMAWKAHRYL